MIDIDFLYRPLGTTDEPRRGKITVDTARYDKVRESYFSRINITDPINIAKEFIGVDPLNTLELTMCFFHTYMTSAGYQFWRWECSENGDFRAVLPA